MNLCLCKLFTPFLVVLLFVVVQKTIQAQEDQVDVTATPQFQIEQDLCPSTGHCWSNWRLSPNGNRLFVYFEDNHQLYTIDPDNRINQHDLSALPAVHSNFDFVPYSEDSILIYNGLDWKIYQYDLPTQAMTEYLPGHRFASCNSDTTPPVRTFVRPFMSHWLVVCGIGSSTEDNRNISVVDLVTDTIYEIGAVNDKYYPGARIGPWRRVFGGHDGAVYAIFEFNAIRELFPDYVDDPMVYTLFKRGIGDPTWTRIDIPLTQLPELTSTAKLGALAGVDSDGNLYFYRFFGDQVGFEPQFAKVTPEGQVVWMLPATAFGESPHLIDVDAQGNLIAVDLKQYDTTVNLSVVQYNVILRPTPASGSG